VCTQKSCLLLDVFRCFFWPTSHDYYYSCVFWWNPCLRPSVGKMFVC
jgi:hypothetical protein